MMRAAFTVWDGRIAPVFDVSREVVLLSMDRAAVAGQRRESIETPTSAGKVDRLIELGVETLVCGAISAPLHRELLARGVRVIGFVAGEVDDVVRSYVAGALPTPTLSMPGCYGRRRGRGGRGRGHGRGNGWRHGGSH